MKFSFLSIIVVLKTAAVAADRGGIRQSNHRDLAVDCESICIDFSNATGTILKHGDYVKYEWFDTYGLTIEASTSVGGHTPDGMARIYNTQTGTDPHLGSPNEKCGGNGVGAGGEPDGAGPNCNANGEGNVLIIQESDEPKPENNAQGGIMEFHFDCPVHKLYSIGLMDLEAGEEAFFFEIFKAGGETPTIQKIVGKGRNSIQEEMFSGTTNLNQVNLVASKSFGVRSICFCPGDCIDSGKVDQPLAKTATTTSTPTTQCGGYELFNTKTMTPLQGSCNAFDQVYKNLCPPVDTSVPNPEHLPPGGSSPTCKGFCCASWSSGGTCPESWQNTWRHAFPSVIVPECDGKEEPGACEVVLVRKGHKDLPDTSCSVGQGKWIFPAITCWTGNDLTTEVRIGVNTKVTLCKDTDCRDGGTEFIHTETSDSATFPGLSELYVECANTIALPTQPPSSQPSAPSPTFIPTAAPAVPSSTPTLLYPTSGPSASNEDECSLSNPPSRCGCDANDSEGIGRAVAGATGPNTIQIRICPGTWVFNEAIDLTDKQIEFSCPSRECVLKGSELPSGGIFRTRGGSKHNLIFRNLIFHQGSVGALYLVDGDAVFGGCTFEESVGAAIYQTKGSTFFNQCTFRHNIDGTDGGVYSLTEGRAGFFKCNFLDNAANSNGGVMFQVGGSSRFDKCKFYRNNAQKHGGVVYLSSEAVSSFNQCDFQDNTAGDYDNIGGETDICDFQGNTGTTGDGVVTAECKADIEDVTMTPAGSVCAGEPVTINVRATDGTQVRIDGVAGASRIMQFNALPGEIPVSIAAISPSGKLSEQTAWITLKECGEAPGETLLPLIGSTLSLVSPSTIHLFVRNIETFGSDVTFKWSVDGKEIDITTGVLTYDFNSAMPSAGPEPAFVIAVEVIGGPRNGASGIRTVSLFNPYGLSKEQGEIRLPTTASAVKEGSAGSMTVSVSIKNPEKADGLLSKERIGFGNCDLTVATTYQENSPVSLGIPAQGKATRVVELKSVPRHTCTIEFSWSGTIGEGALRASVIVLVPSAVESEDVVRLTDETTVRDLNGLLKNGVISPKGVSLSRLEELFMEGVLAKKPNLEGRPSPLFKTTSHGEPNLEGGPSPLQKRATDGEPKLGDICSPGDVPPRPGWACIPSGELDAHGARVVNAQKGDLLLSRSCGIVGGMLSAISPPQHYSHVGIFTTNGAAVRHSYGEENRLFDYFDDGHWISKWETDGFEEHALKYFFPGTITSSINEILTGKSIPDRDGHIYRVKGFKRDPVLCEDDQEVVPPLVVKPPPEYDAQVRPLLHAAADASLNINGHYRMYAYTDGRIIDDPAYFAPSDATDSWDAAGTVPTMCALFVWKSLVDAGARLNPSLEVKSSTVPDGMFYYSKEKRQVAAAWMYSYVYKEAARKDKSGLGQGLFEARTDVANQVTNCFVSDSCGDSAKDSKAWREPGDGITVSPSDVLLWDSPAQGGVYGYSEPAQFTDTYITIEHRWEADVATGTVKGIVSGKDGRPIAGATVYMDTLRESKTTNADGTFVFYPVPEGPVVIDATATIDGQLAFTQFVAAVSAGKTTEVTIVPKLRKRQVTVWGTMKIKDDEPWPTKNKFYWQRIYETIIVEPDRPKQSKKYETCAGGEIRVEITFTAILKDDNSVDVLATQQLFEGTSCKTKDHESEADASFSIKVAEDTFRETTLDSDATGNGEDYAHTDLYVINGDMNPETKKVSWAGSQYVKDRRSWRGDLSKNVTVSGSLGLSNVQRAREHGWSNGRGQVDGKFNMYFLLLPDDSVLVDTLHRFYRKDDKEQEYKLKKIIGAGKRVSYWNKLEKSGKYNDRSIVSLTISNNN